MIISKLTLLQLTLLTSILTLTTVYSIYLTPAQRRNVVNRCNHFRSKVAKKFGVGNMRILEWNKDLEWFSNYQVSKCKWGHSESGVRSQFGGRGPTGETAARSAGSFVRDPTKYWTESKHPVDVWYNGIEFFDFSSMTCRGGQNCHNFVTLTWPKANKMGCAFAPQINVGICRYAFVIFCDYAPGPEEGKTPFSIGHNVCSTCEGDYAKYCIDGLCSRVKTIGELNMTGYRNVSPRILDVTSFTIQVLVLNLVCHCFIVRVLLYW